MTEAFGYALAGAVFSPTAANRKISILALDTSGAPTKDGGKNIKNAVSAPGIIGGAYKKRGRNFCI